MAYVITFGDDAKPQERIDGADAYQQEGPLTTFFRTSPGRTIVDSWSTRLASFRTADIRSVRLVAQSSPALVEGPALVVAGLALDAHDGASVQLVDAGGARIGAR